MPGLGVASYTPPPTHTMIVLLQQETGRGGENLEGRLEKKTPLDTTHHQPLWKWGASKP